MPCLADTAPCLQQAPSSRPSRPAVMPRLRRCRCAASSTAAAVSATQQTPPRMQSKVRLDKLYLDTHAEMCDRGLQALHVNSPLLFTDAFYFRHPDDVWAILSKDDVLFSKSSRVTQTKEWLGQGIFSQLDPDKHTAARATLNPAFRRDYVARLDGFMVSSAQQLAALLAPAAGDAGTETAKRPAPGADGVAGGQAVDMQRLFRLMAIDTIGLTSLNRSFDAVKAWQQQHGAASASAPHSSSSSSGSSDDQLELERRLLDLNAAFLLQALQLPIPRSWLPGWSKYVAACRQLDELISSILLDTRAHMQQQQQLSTAAGSRDDGSSRPTLVSFLLTAQQQQGAEQISDLHILSEIKTVLFGGTDTSAFTLAMCAYNLSQHPAAADRAAAEVQALLQLQQRSSVSQLTADDANKLPWLLACLNETMRLAPAGPVITRTALQDTEVAGFAIPKGKTVATNIYAMHRHPDIWPQPDAWLPQRWIPAEAAAAGLTTRSSRDGSGKAQQPFLPFSTGPRGCIGRNYAMLQMVLALGVLLGSGIRFAPTQGPAPDLVKSMTMHAKQGVWLVPYSCH